MHKLQAWWFSSGSHRSSEAPSPLDAAQEVLQNSLAIFPEPDSSVRTVIHGDVTTARPPDRRRRVGGGVRPAPRGVRDSSSLAFLKDEWDAVELEANAAARALHEFQQENGVYDMKAQRDALFKNIGDLEKG